MFLGFPGMQALSVTTIATANSGSWMIIPNIKNQMGLALFCGTSGIEIGAIGVSYQAAGSVTVISGITTTLNFMNANGASLAIAPNGSGVPIYNTYLEPLSFYTGSPVWVTARANSLTLTIAFLGSDGFGNQ